MLLSHAGKSGKTVFSWPIGNTYLFDSDNHWYYIKPDLGRLKIPLVYALARMNYFKDNPESRPDIFGKDDTDLCVRFPLGRFYEKNKSLIHYFDRWSVFDVAKSSLPPVKVYLKKASEKHIETILWDVPIEPLN